MIKQNMMLVMFLFALFIKHCKPDHGAEPLEFKYYNYNEITHILKNIEKNNPGMAYLYSIGKSVQGLISF